MVDEQEQFRMPEIDPEYAIQAFDAFSKVARIILRGVLLVGIGISGYSGILAWEAASSNDWPTTQGRIITASVEREIVRGKRIDRLNLRYTYTVNGKRYVGQRVSIGPHIGPFEPTPMDVVAHHRLRSSVTVYYHPENPNRSVLEPGVTPTVFFIAFIGPLMVVISLWGLRRLDQAETGIRSRFIRPGDLSKPPVQATAPHPFDAKARGTRPKPIEPGSFETTRRRMIAVLIVLLIALLIAGFFGGEAGKWIEKIRKEFGKSGS